MARRAGARARQRWQQRALAPAGPRTRPCASGGGHRGQPRGVAGHRRPVRTHRYFGPHPHRRLSLMTADIGSDEALSAAVLRYLGRGRFPSPQALADDVLAAHGPVVLADVRALIREIESSPMDWSQAVSYTHLVPAVDRGVPRQLRPGRRDGPGPHSADGPDRHPRRRAGVSPCPALRRQRPSVARTRRPLRTEGWHD